MVFDVEPMRTSKKKIDYASTLWFGVERGKRKRKRRRSPPPSSFKHRKKVTCFLFLFFFAQFQCVFMLFMHVSVLDLDILYFCITLTHTLIRYHARARRIIIRYSHMCKPKGPNMRRNIHESNSIRMCSV